MMTEIKQNRRQILLAIIALGLTGPSFLIEAEANPFPWILRTGAKIVLHGMVAGIHIGSELADVSEMHEEWHANKAFPGSSLVQDNWERHVPYYLTLHIPPGRNAIDDTLLVYLIDTQSGKPEYIASVPLYAPPSRVCMLARLPLPPLDQQGLYRFEVVIPSLNGVITVQNSNPVLLQ